MKRIEDGMNLLRIVYPEDRRRFMRRIGKTEKNAELTKRQIQALNTKNQIYDVAIKNFNETSFNSASRML